MAKIVFDTSSPNDGLGTELRNAFIGVNSNFTELYDNKVDKETGKGLSTNDYTDAERDKLAGIEDGAEVNVQSDWAQNDNTQDDYIKNKPTLTNYVNTIGFFDYNNSNTTPLTLVANTEKKLTNDCVGAYTDISHPTYGVTRLFDPTINNIVLNELGVGDLVKLRVDINVTTATANQNYKCILRLGIGTSKEFEIVIHEEQVKDTGLHKKTIYTGFYVGSDEVRTSLGELVLLSDHAGSVVVNGFLFEAVKRNVNFVELSGGGGSQNLQSVTDEGAVTDQEIEVAGLKLTDTDILNIPLKLKNESGYLFGYENSIARFWIGGGGLFCADELGSFTILRGTFLSELRAPETQIGSPETIATQEYTASELVNKVDKVTGKSLILDTEIARLASMTAIFTTALKTAYDIAYNWVTTNGTNVLNHLTRIDNPHNVNKSQVGLGNVDNTSDLNKPVSAAQATAIATKFDKTGGDLTGTAGAGYLGLPSQSATPSTPASGLMKLFADASGRLSWITSLGFKRTFISASLTADRTYTLQNRDGILADDTDLALKLDKTSWVDYSATSTIVGFSAFTTKQIYYKKISDNVIWVKGRLAGTSNSGLLNFTIPFTSANTAPNIGNAVCRNNGIDLTSAIVCGNTQNTNVIDIYRDKAGIAFTNSGVKEGIFSILIEI